MPICSKHGVQGFHAFACRDVDIAVACDGPAVDVVWWECSLDDELVFSSLVCAGCITKFHLPPSPASLNDSSIPEGVDPNLLATPVCMKCFEAWRKARGVSVSGNYPGIPEPIPR
jgi:hypothetical protein